ncbi:MAG: peptidoglycan DD-metalloendopeptidase family protein [Candidatus Woesearchaeota archaeon]
MKKKSFILISIFLIFIFITFNIYAFPLQLNDRGDNVREIQKYLNLIGYDVLEDGVFGNRTKKAVEDFQFDKGLFVDGIVGKQTLKAIENTVYNITHKVKRGENLSSIALKYDVKINEIKDENNLTSDLITVGQKIQIPNTGIGGEGGVFLRNTYYTVRPGDNLSTIARRYNVDTKIIKLANNLRSNMIRINQKLFIPHSFNTPTRLQKGYFIWPVLGRLTSPFGNRIHPINRTRQFHNGIDIAVPLGTEIRAAASGKVIRSSAYGGFGKTIIIDHGNNIKTLYAHNSRLLVRVGKKVNAGDLIALAGSTGISTGSHLHFTIYRKEIALDPLLYLP